MKLAAVVITYNGDVDETLRNCLTYIDHIDKLIIWENTPKDRRDEFRVNLPEQYANKVIHMGDGINHCISYPLNQAVMWAKDNGYTHLLAMDQDSHFEQGHFSKYIDYVYSHYSDQSVGIFSANPNCEFVKSDSVPTIVSDTITSGSICRLDMFDTTGLFREDFEIDAVDIEFSYRASRYGYSTVVLSWIVLHQQYGSPVRSKLGFYTNNYPPFRIYHIIRNYIIVWREYPKQFIHRKQLIIEFMLKRMVKVLFIESDKGKKLKAFYYGITDGIRKRTIPRTF